MQSEIDTSARLQQVLNFFVALGSPEILVEIDKDKFRHTQSGGTCKLAANEFRYQNFCTMAAAAEFKHIFEPVISIDESRQRATFTQREYIAYGLCRSYFIQA